MTGEGKEKIIVGASEVVQSQSAKLFGIELDEDQKGKSHFHRKGGLIKALNKRMFAIKILSQHVPANKLKKS